MKKLKSSMQQTFLQLKRKLRDAKLQSLFLTQQLRYLLKQMKQNVAGWEADFGKEIMTKEKAWLNLTWSGDAVWAIEEAAAVDDELDYTVPEQGSIVCFDG